MVLREKIVSQGLVLYPRRTSRSFWKKKSSFIITKKVVQSSPSPMFCRLAPWVVLCLCVATVQGQKSRMLPGKTFASVNFMAGVIG